MIINLDEIKKILQDENITAYQIAKNIDLTETMIQRYKTGKSEIENMSLKAAAELQKFINHKKENEMRIIDVYGRELVVEKDTRKVREYSNQEQRIVYNVKIAGENFWTDYEENYYKRGI